MEERDELERDIKMGEICLIIINGLLLVTTIVIACIYYGQLQQMIRATQAARDAAQAAKDTLQEVRNEQRPWIVVKDAKIEVLEPGKQVQVDIILSNFGHSPALDSQFLASLFIMSDPKQDIPPAPPVADEVTHGIVAPGMEEHIRVHSLDFLTKEQVERAKQPDVRYYVYGKGTYQDTTTARGLHHTEFCLYVTYGKAGVTPCNGKRYQNTAD